MTRREEEVLIDRENKIENNRNLPSRLKKINLRQIIDVDFNLDAEY